MSSDFIHGRCEAVLFCSGHGIIQLLNLRSCVVLLETWHHHRSEALYLYGA